VRKRECELRIVDMVGCAACGPLGKCLLRRQRPVPERSAW
jgi:hypothetical protein